MTVAFKKFKIKCLQELNGSQNTHEKCKFTCYLENGIILEYNDSSVNVRKTENTVVISSNETESFCEGEDNEIDTDQNFSDWKLLFR